MKHFMALCFSSREATSPSQKIVLHEEDLASLGKLFETYVYVVVEPLEVFS